MLLGARMLDQVGNVNQFKVVDSIEFTQGDTATVYIQLVDLTKDKAVEGFVPSGRRYVPAAGATLSIKLDNIDDALALTRTATLPFTGDSSIWSFSVLATDKIQGTCALSLTLNESGIITRGRIEAVVLIHSQGAL